MDEKISKLMEVAKCTEEEAREELKLCNGDLELCLQRRNRTPLTPQQVALIKQLRTTTHMSIKDCQKALEKQGWDLDKALQYMQTEMADLLAQKKTEREAKCGGIFIQRISPKSVVYVKLFCETDFVLKNSKFIELGQKVLTEEVDQSLLNQYSSSLGEKIVLGDKKEFKGQNVYYYLHGRSRLGIIDLDKESSIGDQLCQQIVAFAPKDREEFLNQNWFLNSSETVKQKLEGLEVLNFCYETVLA